MQPCKKCKRTWAAAIPVDSLPHMEYCDKIKHHRGIPWWESLRLVSLPDRDERKKEHDHTEYGGDYVVW